MKANIYIILQCLILCSCITEFEPKNTDETDGILVVEGIIADDESVITLSRSKGLSYEDNLFNLTPYHVTDAKVSIECDDGTRWGVASQNSGEYTIITGKLNPERQYRLKIEIEEHEYQSEFTAPMMTPEIDSVFWTKKGTEQPVNIHVATHAPDDMIQYYCWSYREVWELRPHYIMEDKHKGECPECHTFLDFRDVVCPNCGFELERFPYYCWDMAVSKGMLFGSNEKTVLGRLVSNLTEMPPTDIKLEIMYRIDVYQHAITKSAYDYFTNIKKNAEETGGIFAHIPAELKGNITCTTDPARTVIGYMDVSSTAQKRLYVSRLDDAWEPALYCKTFEYSEIYRQNQGVIPLDYIYVAGYGYVFRNCVDCSYGGASKYRPDDWPEI